MKTKKFVIVFMIGSIMLYGRSAYAYIDPGTGSYLLQILLAMFVGGFFFLKVLWGKIKSKLFHKHEEQHHEPPAE